MTSTLEQLTDNPARRRLGGWRAEAWHRFDILAHEITRLRQPSPSAAQAPERLQRIGLLEGDLARVGPKLNSSGPDEVWPEMHKVEEEVARLAQGEQLVDYVSWAVDHLDDPALKGHRTVTTGEAWNQVRAASKKRSCLDGVANLAADVATALHQAHLVIDRKHQDANNCSARLRAATIGIVALCALIILTASAFPQLPFLVGMEKFQGVSPAQLALLVALGGLVGGSWGALPAFTSAEPDRYRVQYVRAAARLAMGVLSALVGVSLVGAGWMTGLTGDSAPALFAVAIAFGLAQEPVTRALEGKLAAKGGDAGAGSAS
jgi:hypothetical protein